MTRYLTNMFAYMKKCILCLIILFLFPFSLYGETTEEEKKSHFNILHNLKDSITYNYGLNFIGAAAGTWIIIENGLDWRWRNTVFNNRSLGNIGSIVMPTGNIVPVATPFIFYISGSYWKNEKTITAAEALAQSLILSMIIQTPLKMISGRREPMLTDRSGLFDKNLHRRIYEEKDFSNEWDLFNMNFVAGWPSGHTTNAFAAAATLSEIYHDNIWVKAGAYTYAIFIGAGTTTSSHWISEAVAGALIGYAIGKTVGKSYRKYLDGQKKEKHLSLYPYSSGNSTGILLCMPI